MKSRFLLVVFFSTISSLILAVGFAGFAGEQGFRDFGHKISEKYSNGAELQQRTVEEVYPADGVTEISVATIGGDVRIEPSTDANIHLNYTYKKFETEKTREQLRDEVAVREGNLLQFRLDKYASEENNISIKMTDLVSLMNIGMTIDEAKAVIRIPIGVRKVTVKAVSGDVKFENQRLQNISLVTVSGDIDFKNCEVDELEYQSVSGDLEMKGAFAVVNARSVSGDLNFESRLPSPTVHFKTTSGDAEIKFVDAKRDVQIDFNTTSGEFRSREESDGQWKRVTRAGSFKDQSGGTAKGLIKIQSVSGDVRVE